MSITKYQCSACKRDIEIVDNTNALTLVNSCIITQFCKGNLSKTSTRPGSIVGNNPPLVDGIQDYQKTNRLYSHIQPLPSSSWKITHDLNSNPLTYVYVKSVNNTYTPIDDDDYVVTVIDSNNITIQFADKIVGIAHIISRANAEQPVVFEISQTTQISANGILTIASPVIEDDQSVISYNLAASSPTTNQTTIIPVNFTAHKFEQSVALFNTPWKDVQLVTGNNILYRVRSCRVANLLNSGVEQNSLFYFVDNPNIIMLSSSAPYDNIADISHLVVPVTQTNIAYNRIIDSQVVVQTSEMVDYFPQLTIYKTIYQ